MAERNRSGHQRAHAGSGDKIYGNCSLAKRLYNTDVSECAGATARKHKADCLSKHKPRDPGKIDGIATPDMKDAVTRKVLQPVTATGRECAVGVVEQDEISDALQSRSIVDRPLTGPDGACRSIGDEDDPVGLPEAAACPALGIPAGDVNHEGSGRCSGFDRLGRPLTLRIINDRNLSTKLPKCLD